MYVYLTRAAVCNHYKNQSPVVEGITRVHIHVYICPVYVCNLPHCCPNGKLHDNVQKITQNYINLPVQVCKGVYPEGGAKTCCIDHTHGVGTGCDKKKIRLLEQLNSRGIPEFRFILPTCVSLLCN